MRYSVEGGVKKHRGWERLVGHDGLASGGRRRKAREGPGDASARVEVRNCGRRGRTCMRKLVRAPVPVCSRVDPCLPTRHSLRAALRHPTQVRTGRTKEEAGLF